jgi:hypothetical protein
VQSFSFHAKRLFEKHRTSAALYWMLIASQDSVTHFAAAESATIEEQCESNSLNIA